jgi:thiamine-monophosphate kinase
VPPKGGRPAPSTSIGEIGEFGLIDRLVGGLGSLAPPSPAGPGDDAAVLPTGPSTLVTTDTLEEDVHFRRAWFLPEEVGEKALEINFSDIAAMGGRPTAALLSLVLPPDLPVGAVDALYRGVARAARRAKVTVAGGNVSASASGRIAIHVTVLGRPTARKPVLRSGGSPGDLLVVTGYPGLAALGRLLIDREAPREGLPEGLPQASQEPLWSGTSREPSWRREITSRYGPVARVALTRFLTPRARLDSGSWAATHGATAMIDLSDGLAGDIRHLAKASRAGARLDAGLFPQTRGFPDLLRELGLRPLDLALSGGEDYELLFAIPAGRWKRLAKPRGTPLHVVGEILPARRGLSLVDSAGERPLVAGGFRHFAGQDGKSIEA